METINHILAAFDLSSLFSAIFPVIAESFQKGFSSIYETILSVLAEVIVKVPVVLPVAGFLFLYFSLSLIFRRLKTIRVRS